MYCLLLFSYLAIYSRSALSQEVEANDIPIIEGDGGTITTSVEDDVLILTQENFDLQVFSKDIILVEFYAPWCGHCQSLAPEFAKAAAILKDKNSPISLAKVDATVESDLASRYEVTGYPTLFVFRKGEKYPYDGPRSSLGIVEYMMEQADPNWKPPLQTVITLTNENFTEVVNNAEIILVEFYAPWCGHCKKLAPEYERASKILKDLPKPIVLAKIDGTIEQTLANQYGAHGWPTMIIFRKGKQYAYDGPREESGIVAYMKDQAKLPSHEVASAKSLRNAISKTEATVIGFFDGETDRLYMEYIESANSFRGKLSFLHTFDHDIAQQFEVTRRRIVLYQPEVFVSDYEPRKYEFSSENGNSQQLNKFLMTHSLPLVGQRSRQVQWKYQGKYPLVVVYYSVDFGFENRIQSQLVRKEVTKVAKDFIGEITFVVCDEEEYQDELEQLKLDDSGEDVNVGYFASERERYRMEPTEDFSADELREFVEGVQAGKIPRFIKSQLPPKENKGPVITIVASTFDELVTKSSKDVLLEFYAPWCGHCKKFEPIYKKIGKRFSENENVIIGKMDATANDYPDPFNIQGFPTLIYIPASDKKNMITFEGDYTLEGVENFIKKHLRSSRDEL